MIALTAGCAPRGPAPAPQPVTLTIAAPQFKDLGPERRPDAAVAASVIERLTTYDAQGRPAPKVAERWQQSPDGLTWRLTIRRGVLFQDGTPLTAEHVRAAIQAVAADAGRQAGTVCLSDVVNVSVEAEYDVVIRLSRPCSYLLDDLDVDLSRDGSGTTRIGTGPFRPITSSADEATFRANPTYYGGAPAVDHVVVRAYPTLRAAWADMMRGRLDLLMDVGPEGVEFLHDQSTIDTRSYTSFSALAIVLNSGRAALSRRETRRALSVAINRAELVQQGLKGQGLPADMPVWPPFWALDRQSPAVPYDPAGAVKILSRGKPLTFTCLLPTDRSVFERLALLVQRQLRAVGVDMRLEVLPTRELFVRVGKGDFDAVLIDPLGGPYASFQYRFWHSPDTSPRWNQFNYGSAIVDAALDTMRGALNDEQFKVGMRQYVTAVRDDPPAIFLVWPTRMQAISRRFVLPTDADGTDAVRGIAGWRLREDPR